MYGYGIYPEHWFSMLCISVAMLNAVFLCYISVGGYRLKGYIGERRGEREDMQDAHTIIDDFTPHFSSLPNNM